MTVEVGLERARVLLLPHSHNAFRIAFDGVDDNVFSGGNGLCHEAIVGSGRSGV